MRSSLCRFKISNALGRISRFVLLSFAFTAGVTFGAEKVSYLQEHAMTRTPLIPQPEDALLERMFDAAGKVPVSFELFPPRRAEDLPALFETVDQLAPVAVGGFSVTMSAGGATRGATHEISAEVMRRSNRATTAHLVSLGLSKQQALETADAFWKSGITRILALRGDRPKSFKGAVPPGFEHAADLVAALASRHPFEISVAAHPEKHPEALSLDADIGFLKRKIDAGASRAYCQFVLDPEIYGRFLDACGNRGIDIPIVPGVMPPDDWHRMRRFALANDASVPRWLDQLFAQCGQTPALMPHLAAAVTVEHVRRLIAYGAPELHVYTMNRWELPLLVAHLLGHPSLRNASNGT